MVPYWSSYNQLILLRVVVIKSKRMIELRSFLLIDLPFIRVEPSPRIRWCPFGGIPRENRPVARRCRLFTGMYRKRPIRWMLNTNPTQ
jgi:hypothetical protein